MLPCQQNNHDCGVMICQYAKYLVYAEQITEVWMYMQFQCKRNTLIYMNGRVI